MPAGTMDSKANQIHSPCELYDACYFVCREKVTPTVSYQQVSTGKPQHADSSIPRQDYNGLFAVQKKTCESIFAPSHAGTQNRSDNLQCDEARPTCRNCSRRREACNYTGEDRRSSNSIHENEVSSSAASPVSRSCLPANAYDGLDLALMHRYSTVTSIHLFPTEGGRQVWQGFVPAKAETCDVLQRGMLALAAMDMAYLCTIDEPVSSRAATYRERALHHQQAALPGFRELIQSPDLSDRNSAFIFSIMLIIMAFGTAHSATTKPTLEDILDFFALFRGPKTLWQLHGDVANSDLVDRMSPPTAYPQPFPSVDDEALQEVKELALDDVCAEALKVLCGAWGKYDANREDVRSVAFFPAVASEAFYDEVRKRNVNALRILAHYATLLSKFKSRWWIGSWDSILLDAIATSNNSLANNSFT